MTNIGPPSASLLQDWLGIDVGQLNPEDMDAMEKELEAGAPDMFFNDLWWQSHNKYDIFWLHNNYSILLAFVYY